jgi:hypothetical protein
MPGMLHRAFLTVAVRQSRTAAVKSSLRKFSVRQDDKMFNCFYLDKITPQDYHNNETKRISIILALIVGSRSLLITPNIWVVIVVRVYYFM